ncbi:MAG: GrpE protein [Candidatus Scalindua rubra]|uniref:Protein GrpE n=1 Tax=Candidatus Scalindua rubra TaxID=1872076 RepID=A0A1E3X831_9BACT|nr:MAG: GrpE protein [Candidatus Scalindua rubra]
MSKVQKNQDAKDTDVVNSDDDQKNIEKSQEDLESKVEIKAEDESEREEKKDESEIEEQVVLTKEDIVDLKKKAEERDSFLDKLLRTRAEYSNYQKRMRKEHETIAQFAIQDLVLDLFPELDNFERAIKLADSSKDIDKFVEGIKLIEDQLFKVLGKYGVKAIETVGKSFDPNLHEAVLEEDNDKLPHHTIIEELQRGFILKERVIRPSKVKVSKRTVEEEVSDKESDDIKNDNSLTS